MPGVINRFNKWIDETVFDLYVVNQEFKKTTEDLNKGKKHLRYNHYHITMIFLVTELPNILQIIGFLSIISFLIKPLIGFILVEFMIFLVLNAYLRIKIYYFLRNTTYFPNIGDLTPTKMAYARKSIVGLSNVFNFLLIIFVTILMIFIRMQFK